MNDDARKHQIVFTFRAYAAEASRMVASGDYTPGRFGGYHPRDHFRKASPARDPGIAAAVDRATEAILTAGELCRAWAAAPPADRDEVAAAARAYFEDTLLPELRACLDGLQGATG